MTFLNLADSGYRVTRDPGLRAWTLERLEPRTTTTRPRHQELFSRFSSIGARRAGGEARFDDLLLRAARGIVQCHSVMRYDLTKRVAYCVEGMKFLRGTRHPPRPGPTLIIIYTFIIWPTAPRPGRTDPARTPHAPRSSGPTGRHLSSPGRLVAFNLIKSVGHAVM